jgi:molybdopterin adenylyltransferase
MGTREHKQHAPSRLKVGVLSISSTRNLENDAGGQWIRKEAEKEGHTVVCHRVVIDDVRAIRNALCEAINSHGPQLIIMTGGTGLAPKDVTIEAVRPLFRKELTAFGPVVAQLSFEEIDSAAILSRATAGIVGKAVVCCIPGSINACKLICRNLIFPEAGHLVKHLNE